MPLRIVRESDPIEITQLIVVIYAPPGLGKTSLAFTADDPILFDFDKGMHRSRNRRDGQRVQSWEEVCGLTAADFAPYKTVVVDTAGRALDFLSSDIIRGDSKMGRGGALTIQGFGVLKNRFTSWLNMLREFGKDVILTAHSDEKQRGDDTVERLDMQGGSKNEVYKCADLMGRLSMRDGKRFLTFSPTDAAFGKDPAGFGTVEVPDFALEPNFLAGIIRDAKARINSQTDRQIEAAQFLETWRVTLEAAMTPTDFNNAVEEIGKAECSTAQRSVVKRLIMDRAASKDVAFDKASKSFVAKA
jgi:hypothetical protein